MTGVMQRVALAVRWCRKLSGMRLGLATPTAAPAASAGLFRLVGLLP